MCPPAPPHMCGAGRAACGASTTAHAPSAQIMNREANKVAPVNDSLYADALAPFLAEVERLRPADAEVIDAHTHLGLDEDGRSLTLPQLLAQLDDAQARRACVFPLHDPERHPPIACPTTASSPGRAKARGG